MKCPQCMGDLVDWITHNDDPNDMTLQRYDCATCALRFTGDEVAAADEVEALFDRTLTSELRCMRAGKSSLAFPGFKIVGFNIGAYGQPGNRIDSMTVQYLRNKNIMEMLDDTDDGS